MPDRETRILSKETLERRNEGQFGSGNQVIEASIVYRKDGRPRGYYLRVHVYRDLDDGGTMHAIFSDPYKNVLLQETKAFSEKTLHKLTIRPDILDATIALVKSEYAQKRAKEVGQTSLLEAV